VEPDIVTLAKLQGQRSYWERRYEDWWDRPFHGIACTATDEFMAREEAGIRAKLPALLKPDHLVLDAGCGYGRIAPMIAPLVAEYVGVDFSAKAIEQARATAPENAQFIVGDIVDVNGEFDVIVMVGIQSSVSYRPEVIDHLRSLLVEDGLIAVFEYGADRAIGKDGSTWPL
jgi:cyclopropane fatty-acyl-phospholipid synthase-like methyltransferase